VLSCLVITIWFVLKYSECHIQLTPIWGFVCGVVYNCEELEEDNGDAVDEHTVQVLLFILIITATWDSRY